MIDATLLTCDPTLMPNDPSVPNSITTTLGNRILFQIPGVQLPLHAHTDANIHATIVLSGSISVVRGTDAPVSYYAGDMADFVVGVDHSITALESNTLIFNITKLGNDIANVQATLTQLKTNVATAITQFQAEVATLTTNLANLKTP